MLPAALFLTALIYSVSPVEVIVFDSSLQRVVGYGKQSGNQLRVELLDGYSGPVVAMVLQNKVSSVQGVLVGGQLTLSTTNGSTTLSNLLDSLGVDLKLTVVKAPKLDVDARDNPGGAGNNGNSGNAGGNPSGNAGNNGNSGNAGGNPPGNAGNNGNSGNSNNTGGKNPPPEKGKNK
ncbi:hypothetical protein [Deinococcus cellulosilyticus]|nr:hypothetical protein [Deinococcus cellulosilyticus]